MKLPLELKLIQIEHDYLWLFHALNTQLKNNSYYENYKITIEKINT